MAREAFCIAGIEIDPGSRGTASVPLPKLNSHTELNLPVHVVHGKTPGPTLFVSAAVHGDELNGVEICQRLLEHKGLQRLHGTLLVIPVVNVYGMIHQTRYLPDRRDLNRSFPGSEKGSLAGRVANLFMREIVARCTHGIDLHTGAILRSNLPQIRANLEDPATAELARAFGVPVLLNSPLRDGSLREAAASHDVISLLYEAGEALRYNEIAIRAGYHGVINVMRSIGMLRASKKSKGTADPFVARTSSWVRAPESGMIRDTVPLGKQVAKGDVLGHVSDPYSSYQVGIVSPFRGIVIGRSESPMTHEGDAMFHIARFHDDIDEIEGTVDDFNQTHTDEDLFDDG
ncbi:MAG: succinylglutamate desuccinylase/aspartoacylase family protein [Sedimenticolaceae bacterium]